jgi:excisionase family DNA binding protein
MQAYASAELSPQAPKYRLAPVPSVAQIAPVAVNGEASARLDDTVSQSSILASLILDGLDDHGLAVLARRLLPHLTQSAAPEAARVHVAYTVASLAAELGVSQKTIRCAIARRELPAVKRGSRWIISADAVQAWATESDVRRRTARFCSATAPKAAGPSLRSVLSGGSSRGGAR